KREDLCHTGAHKINNALGQVLLARRMGKQRIIAETGAGQHGVAVATVCAKFGLDCEVYMGVDDMARQAINVDKMRLLGATVTPVDSGSKTLKDATNEAIRDWVTNVRTTHYIIGSPAGPVCSTARSVTCCRMATARCWRPIPSPPALTTPAWARSTLFCTTRAGRST